MASNWRRVHDPDCRPACRARDLVMLRAIAVSASACRRRRATCRPATWPTSTWPGAGRPSPSWASRRSGPTQLSHALLRPAGPRPGGDDRPARPPAGTASPPRCCRRCSPRCASWPATTAPPARSCGGCTTASLVESVLMGYPDRVTVCVCSQAGCGMACPFCATGQAGLTRNLSTAEIVDQVVWFAGVAAARRGARAAPTGCRTSCSWAWASRWPTTPGCSRRDPPADRPGAGGAGPVAAAHHRLDGRTGAGDAPADATRISR